MGSHVTQWGQENSVREVFGKFLVIGRYFYSLFALFLLPTSYKVDTMDAAAIAAGN